MRLHDSHRDSPSSSYRPTKTVDQSNISHLLSVVASQPQRQHQRLTHILSSSGLTVVPYTLSPSCHPWRPISNSPPVSSTRRSNPRYTRSLPHFRRPNRVMRVQHRAQTHPTQMQVPETHTHRHTSAKQVRELMCCWPPSGTVWEGLQVRDTGPRPRMVWLRFT